MPRRDIELSRRGPERDPVSLYIPGIKSYPQSFMSDSIFIPVPGPIRIGLRCRLPEDQRSSQARLNAVSPAGRMPGPNYACRRTRGGQGRAYSGRCHP
jgi:hypothetical protein